MLVINEKKSSYANKLNKGGIFFPFYILNETVIDDDSWENDKRLYAFMKHTFCFYYWDRNQVIGKIKFSS